MVGPELHHSNRAVLASAVAAGGTGGRDDGGAWRAAIMGKDAQLKGATNEHGSSHGTGGGASRGNNRVTVVLPLEQSPVGGVAVVDVDLINASSGVRYIVRLPPPPPGVANGTSKCYTAAVHNGLVYAFVAATSTLYSFPIGAGSPLS